MTSAAQRYLQLENQLNSGRELDSSSGTDYILKFYYDEDAILEEMGDIWWDMTDDERDEANLRAKNLQPDPPGKGGMENEFER